MACCHIWETAYSSGPYLSGGGGKGGGGGGGEGTALPAVLFM